MGENLIKKLAVEEAAGSVQLSEGRPGLETDMQVSGETELKSGTGRDHQGRECRSYEKPRLTSLPPQPNPHRHTLIMTKSRDYYETVHREWLQNSK